MRRQGAIFCGLLWQFSLITSFQPFSLRSSSRPTTTPATVYIPQLSAPSPTALQAKLWDRLEIEEDPEPMWYLLNCVATQELDLLYQCREVCQGHPDAIRFVVPTEKKTRSHGANKMVTETKVKYQGYVFAKIRLCPEIYERIQQLDLCRSWMGTVNHKGYKKLPPAPVALNEMEVENFGLEEWEDEEKSDEVDETGVIVDIGDEEDMKSKIDEEAVKAFQGLKVEDMVKVTAPGKFYNEDGIVRRLKDGKIMVRFYTYGTMFEEWLLPGDVRKLTELEVLRGLSGPTQPITQEQLDGPQRGSRDRGDYQSPRNRAAAGGANQRNRRQDRVAGRFGREDNVEQNRNERNWNWYQEQQQQKGQETPGRTGDGYMRAGSSSRSDDWVLGDVDSQWGRGGKTDRRPQNQVRRSKQDNRRAQGTLDGDDDWSSFVSPVGGRNSAPSASGSNDDADDFFASLMSDLSKDLDNSKSSSPDNAKRQASDTTQEDGMFFDSLMAELSAETASAPVKDERRPQRREPARKPAPAATTNQDEDFFAALEAELGSELGTPSPSSTDDGTDDFFAQLEAELSPPSSDGDGSSSKSADAMDDFLNDMFEDTPPPAAAAGPQKSAPAPAGKKAPPKKQAEPALTPTMAKESKAAAAAAATSLDSTSLSKCTVPILKDMLRERGLKVSGKKAELIERLTQ